MVYIPSEKATVYRLVLNAARVTGLLRNAERSGLFVVLTCARRNKIAIFSQVSDLATHVSGHIHYLGGNLMHVIGDVIGVKVKLSL
jgi:hypothetical protein